MDKKPTGDKSEINRRARIIVRNLSFKSTEKSLKKYFMQFGNVVEAKLLKKPDGKLVGCAFIQFEVVQNAAKAIFHANSTEFLGRVMVCDWALGKDTYVKNIKEAMSKEIKEEEDEVIELKEEKVGDVEESTQEDVKEESDEDEDEKEGKNDSDEEEDDDGEEDDDDDGEEDDDEEEDEEVIEPEVKRPRVISNDVQEGKTIFIKNVPFSATNDDIKNCMEQFGPLYYALVCVDRLTEYSKGTAFVKFVNLEDAKKCLEAGTELTIKGQILDCHKAVSKNDLDNNKSKKEVRKDTRNLYLIKEGVIMAGSRAAQSVSGPDMAKRLELERWKSQILRNLNMFVSRYRLIIHNLPEDYTEKQLRELFLKFSGANAFIKEARVMKDLKNYDAEGKPKSKGYGFVSYSDHDDALHALRTINNNPSVFTRAKRPIVAFSIENKSVINARKKRLEKSKLHNPTSKDYDKSTAKNSQPDQKAKYNKQYPAKQRQNDQRANEYSGLTGKPGAVQKMRTKYKLKQQAQIHHETVKEERKKTKLTRKVLKRKKLEHMKQVKQKKMKGKHKKTKEDNFGKIVKDYKNSVDKSAKVDKPKKRKWYET